MSISYTQEELKSNFRLLFDKGDEHPSGELRKDLITFIAAIDNMRNSWLVDNVSRVKFEYDDIGTVELSNSSDNTKLYVYNEDGAIINTFYTEDSKESDSASSTESPWYCQRSLFWGKISVLINAVCIVVEIVMRLNHISDNIGLIFILGAGIAAATVLGSLSIGLHSWNN